MAGRFPSVQRVVEAVEGALDEFGILDAITFSGNGEPTMHPEFALIVREVRRLRDRLMPSVPIALLSNSSLCTDEKVRAAISDADLRIMKLEVGSQRMLEKMNRPGAKVTFERLVSALADMPGTIIQALFVKGSVDNRDDAALQDWVSALARVRPIEVQIYSLDRPAPDKGLVAIGIDKLESIAELVRSKLGLKAKAYGR